jgi:RNA polymerase sigma-70 factor (ECF subfamily)
VLADTTSAGTDASSSAAAFVATFRPALVRYFLRRCGTATEAEDLAQDVIVRALGAVDGRSDEEAKCFVFTIAANRWRDRLRRQGVRGAPVGWDDEAEFAVDAAVNPERVLTHREDLSRVMAALLDLNESTRDIFILHRLERMKQADIAAAFGISVSAVEKHIVKALTHLARRLSDHASE